MRYYAILYVFGEQEKGNRIQISFGFPSGCCAPLNLPIDSVTTNAALVVGGLTLMVLPSIIVGNELLIVGGFRWVASGAS